MLVTSFKSLDNVHFLHPVSIGDTVTLKAGLVRTLPYPVLWVLPLTPFSLSALVLSISSTQVCTSESSVTVRVVVDSHGQEGDRRTNQLYVTLSTNEPPAVIIPQTYTEFMSQVEGERMKNGELRL